MLKVFAMRDVKADAYGNIVALPTRGLAMRGFVDSCASKDSPLRQHPEDYTLYELGTFDETCGVLIPNKLPEFVMSAVEAVALLERPSGPQLPLPGTSVEEVGR